MAQKYFATIEPGLEEALLAEVRELGGKRATIVRGGVEFDATNAVFYRCALRLRCANRLWLRVDEFRARDVRELYRKVNRIDWGRILPPSPRLDVRAASRDSRLNHTGKIAETVESAIGDLLGPPNRAAEPFTILARLVDDRCAVSLDAAGELLFRRGYKQDVGHAPLRESVAAALLRLAGWTEERAVYDPLCGSGTFVIEAAQRSAGVAAGADRAFDLERWANFRPELWRDVKGEERRAVDTHHFGSDAGAEAVDAARANAMRAGVADRATFFVAELDSASLDARPDLVIANPPWNVRIADPKLSIAHRLIEWTTSRFPDADLALLAPRSFQASDLEVVASFDLGGTPVRLWKRAAVSPEPSS